MISTDRIVELQDMAFNDSIGEDLHTEETKIYNSTKLTLDSYMEKLTELIKTRSLKEK